MSNDASVTKALLATPALCKGLQDFMQGLKTLSPALCKGLQDLQGFFNLYACARRKYRKCFFLTGGYENVASTLASLV